MSDTTPNIPAIPASVDSSVRRALDEIKRWFSGTARRGGAVTRQDMIDAGVIAPSGGWGSDIPTPPQLALTAAGGFAQINLSYTDLSSTPYLSHYEIFRATVNDVGQAAKIGSSDAPVYPDTPPNASRAITYYYWVRAVYSSRDVVKIGPYSNSAAASTADDPDYVLEILQNSKWKPATAVTAGSYVYPTRPNGKAYKATVGGNTGATEPNWPTTVGQSVVDGAVTWLCDADMDLDSPFMIGLVGGVVRMVIRDVLIADEAVTNSKIKNLSADKLYAAIGTIADAIIGTGHITDAMIGNLIQSTSYVPGSSGWYINKNGTVEFNGGTFRGAVQFTGPSSGYAQLSDKPTSLSGINSTEGTKLTGIEAGATVGAPTGTVVGSTPAETVESNAASGANASASIINAVTTWAWNTTIGINGWTVAGATQSIAAGILTLTSTGADPTLTSPTLSFDGGRFDVLAVRMKRTGGSGWQGAVYYSTAGHGFSESYKQTVAAPSGSDWVTLIWDMRQIADWKGATITGLKFDFGNSATDVFQIEGITLGYQGASQVGWVRPNQTTIDGNVLVTGDAYVDTLQIKGSAVTIPLSASAGAVTLNYPQHSGSTVITERMGLSIPLVITVSAAAPHSTILLASLQLAPQGAGTIVDSSSSILLELTRNGSIIATGRISPSTRYVVDVNNTVTPAGYSAPPAIVQHQDSPGVGTHTYNLQIAIAYGYASVPAARNLFVEQRTLLLLGTKR